MMNPKVVPDEESHHQRTAFSCDFGNHCLKCNVELRANQGLNGRNRCRGYEF